MGRTSLAEIAVADEVWVAVALLHREQPDREDFSSTEILERAAREGIVKPLRAGVRVHINQHCVASRPPNSGPYRMLVETAPGRRRLFRPDDEYHPKRAGGKTRPEEAALPERYRDLLTWYEERWGGAGRQRYDSILGLRGLGREMWEGIDPDDYVRRLREGWE